MADEVESTPVKRGPGRPRKVQPAATPEPKAPEIKSDPDDPRIGEFVHEGAHWISFPDGKEYRCADGVITERVH
jgi:hypothetical protein